MKIRKYQNGGGSIGDEDSLNNFLEEGGATADILTGGLSAIYGANQLRRANRELTKIQADAPPLETPSQYFNNYKNAYDSELARIESDALQSNLATSIQALQGAGGRALVGGLNAAVTGNQAARNKMLADERKLRLTAGQQLANAEEETRRIRLAENVRQQNIAQASAQAARSNVAAGLTNVATGVMFGGLGQIKDLASGLTSKKPVDASTPTGKKTKTQTIITDEQLEAEEQRLIDEAEIEQLPKIDTRDLDEQERQKAAEDEARRQRAIEFRRQQQAEALTRTDATAVAGVRGTGDLTQQQTFIIDQLNKKGAVEYDTKNQFITLNVIDPETNELAKVPNPFFGLTKAQAAELATGVKSIPDSDKESTFGQVGLVKGVARATPKPRPNLNLVSEANLSLLPRPEDAQIQAELERRRLAELKKQSELKAVQAEIRRANRATQDDLLQREFDEILTKGFKAGGMMTTGAFNHDTNPIDIVQDGVKVGEATGQEYIINPTQAKQIAKQSSYARQLFKRFERNAKKNK